jgi:hypothetical protein
VTYVPQPGDRRYDVSFFIGPCSEKEAGALADAILELDEFKSVGGGGVGLQVVEEVPERVVGKATHDLQDEHGPPYVVTEDVAKGELLLVGPELKKGDPPQVVKMTGLTSD